MSVFLYSCFNYPACKSLLFRAVLCYLDVSYFSTLSHKRHYFFWKTLLNILFGLQRLSEIFLVLRSIQRDSIINIQGDTKKGNF
jgi:hypothetical protein